MNLFDVIKDAMGLDGEHNLGQLEKHLVELQQQVDDAQAKGDVGAAARAQGEIESVKARIDSLKEKLGRPSDEAAPGADIASVDVPAAPTETSAASAATSVSETTPKPIPATLPTPHVDAAETVAPAPQPAEEYRTYTVKEGDSLSSIGRQFGIEYSAIMKLNNIEDPDLIYTGQVFKIPNA